MLYGFGQSGMITSLMFSLFEKDIFEGAENSIMGNVGPLRALRESPNLYK